MAAVVVRATIDAKGKTVTFAGSGGDPTFRVKVGDAITWQLEGVPEGSAPMFGSSPFSRRPGRRCSSTGNSVEGNGAVINGGAVAQDAFDGDYSYEIELLTAQGGTTKLACLWTHGTSKATPRTWPEGKRAEGPGSDSPGRQEILEGGRRAKGLEPGDAEPPRREAAFPGLSRLDDGVVLVAAEGVDDRGLEDDLGVSFALAERLHRELDGLHRLAEPRQRLRLQQQLGDGERGLLLSQASRRSSSVPVDPTRALAVAQAFVGDPQIQAGSAGPPAPSRGPAR